MVVVVDCTTPRRWDIFRGTRRGLTLVGLVALATACGAGEGTAGTTPAESVGAEPAGEGAADGPQPGDPECERCRRAVVDAIEDGRRVGWDACQRIADAPGDSTGSCPPSCCATD